MEGARPFSPARARRSPLLVAAALTALSIADSARAQDPSPPPEDSQPAEPQHPIDDELARKHYEDGRAAEARGDLQVAYTSYRAAVAVREHPLILSALGLASHRLGKHRDAAEYLSLYLLKAPDTDPPDARKAAKTALDEARKHVGALTITAPDGAEVLVEHALVGKAPLGREVFVEAGERLVEARSGDQVGKQLVTVDRGAAAAVTVVFGAAPPPRIVPTRTPSLAPTGAGEPAKVPFLSTQRAIGLAIGGAGLLGIGLGSGFGLLAIAKNDESNLTCDEDDACDQTGLNLRRASIEAATVSTVSFIAGGVALAAGAVVFLTAPSTSGKPSPTGKAPPPSAAVSIGPGSVHLVGRW